MFSKTRNQAHRRHRVILLIKATINCASKQFTLKLLLASTAAYRKAFTRASLTLGFDDRNNKVFKLDKTLCELKKCQRNGWRIYSKYSDCNQRQCLF